MRPKEDSSVAVKEPRHRWISALLFVGHVVETGLQLYICYHYWNHTTRWAASMSALLLTTVVTINLASIIGVHRSLDFADRWFGQCLCYVMHFCLFGMVWRYLKLALMYDRTDVREFALLRFIQVHLQTLPSLLLQSCLIYQNGLVNVSVVALPATLAMIQLVEVALTIALSTLVLSSKAVKGDEENSGQYQRMSVPSLSSLCQTISSDKVSDDGEEWPLSSGGIHQCFIVTLRCMCLLWCRIVSVGVFMTEFHVWTLIVFGVHWCIALLWLVLQDSPSETGQKTPSPAVSLFRRALVAYLLVFDWPPRYRQSKQLGQTSRELATKSAGSWLDVIGVGGHPRSIAIAVYYGINGMENAAMLSLWFHFAPASDLVPAVARLSTLASCTAAFTLGVLCVMATAQASGDELHKMMDDPAAADSERSCLAKNELGSKPLGELLTQSHVKTERERKTVVAEVHKGRTTRANPISVPSLTKPAMTLEDPKTEIWERVSLGDESSNSRNTNTLEGALVGSGSGSGLGAGSCPSPVVRTVGAVLLRESKPTLISTQRRRPDSSPYRDPSSFTGSRSSFSALTVLRKRSAYPTKPRCPGSSTPRLARHNSSCSSLPSIRVKPRPRISKTMNPRRLKHKTPTCRRKSFCHCQIFDFDEQEPGMGILFKESQGKTFQGIQQGTSSTHHLTHKLTGDFRQFQILCASCLQGHDPLLTQCTYCHDGKYKSLSVSRPSKVATRLHAQSRTLPTQPRKLTAETNAHCRPAPLNVNNSVYSTDYPSDTEITCTRRSVSSCSDSSYDSDATYTTWPPVTRIPTMERLLSQNDPSPWNYVHAWLLNSNQVGQETAPTTTRNVSVTKPTLPRQRTNRRHEALTSTEGAGARLNGTIARSEMDDIYGVYCTVPPRLGRSSHRDLTLPWSEANDCSNTMGIVV